MALPVSRCERLLRRLGAGLLFAIWLPTAAAEDCVDYRPLFDPALGMAARHQTVAQLEQAERAGSSAAAYVLGLLYLRPAEHGVAVVPRAPEKAEALLARAAVAGRLEAMAALTDVALERRKGTEAAVWAQLLFHYSGTPGVSASLRTHAVRNISQATDFMPHGKEADAVFEYVGGMVTKYDAAIRAGLAAGPGVDHAVCGAASAAGLGVDPDFVLPEAEAKAARKGLHRGVAVLLVEVSGNGRVRSAHELATIASPATTQRLVELVALMRFSANGDPDSARYAIVPLSRIERFVRKHD